MSSFYPKIKKLGIHLGSDYVETTKTALRNKSDVLYDPSFELRRYCGFYVENEAAFKKIVTALRPYSERTYDVRHAARLRASTVPKSNIVFELKDNYASFCNENAPFRMLNPKGRTIPGTHSFKTAFYLHSARFKVKTLEREPAFMTDIAPTILNLFGLRSSTIGSPLVKIDLP